MYIVSILLIIVFALSLFMLSLIYYYRDKHRIKYTVALVLEAVAIFLIFGTAFCMILFIK